MAYLPWLLLTVLACSYVAESVKVLVVFPFPGNSHIILSAAIVRHLIKAGHEVTYITPFINKQYQHPKLRQIDVSESMTLVDDNTLDIQKLMNDEIELGISFIFNLTMKVQRMTFENPDVIKLCRDPKETFDVIIAEWMFNELHSSFAAIFQSPLIWFSTMDPHWLVLRLIDQPTNPTYTADTYSTKIPPYTFFDRVEQLFYQIIGLSAMKFMTSGVEQEIYEEIHPLIKYRGHKVPDFETLRYNSSLMLGNSHVSMGSAMPLPQSYKPIGGYHIDHDVKPLPENLQKLMDNAKHGVIYFSMGSNLKSKSFPVEIKKNLLKVFGTLKQTVIWKFEEVLPDAPANVNILPWAPQASILAHPNCVLFITHGGLLSTTETIHFGKPIIGIPVFADQFVNVNKAVQSGFAKKVDLTFNLADDLKVAMDEVLKNPSYSRRVKELSFIYHHRPVSPGAELVHWVEHVALMRGAPHLRSPALDVPFYQRYFLDLAVLVAAILITLYILLKRICKKKQPQNKQKRN